MRVQTQANNMGFDILIWGILLLLCPIYRITDVVAAVILIAAFRKSGKYLSEMLRAEKFSYAFFGLGILEIIFGYIFPLEIVLGGLEVARVALLSAIFLSAARGLSELAMVAENASLHDRASGLIKPIYIICAAKMAALVLSGFFPATIPVLICAKVCEAVLIIMIFLTVFKFYQNINVYPAAQADDEDELS